MTTLDDIHRLGMRLRQYARYSLGRILGTVPITSGRYKYHIDHQERSLFMRADLNALTGLLVKKGVFTEQEWNEAWTKEAEQYCEDLARQWPEIQVAHNGRSFQLDTVGFDKRCKAEEWPP